jgi:hypothetical protein
MCKSNIIDLPIPVEDPLNVSSDDEYASDEEDDMNLDIEEVHDLINIIFEHVLNPDTNVEKLLKAKMHKNWMSRLPFAEMHASLMKRIENSNNITLQEMWCKDKLPCGLDKYYAQHFPDYFDSLYHGYAFKNHDFDEGSIRDLC